MPMNKSAGIRPPQPPMRQQQPYTPAQQFQSNPAAQQGFDMDSMQQQRPSARPVQRAPMPPPPVASPVDDFQDPHTFEPPSSTAPMQQAPEQQDEYYSYGSINLEPMTNQQQNPMAGPNEGYVTFDQAAVPPPLQPEFDPSGGKTDLDLEIERYQREIEEKQRRGGGRAPAPAQQQQPGYIPSQQHQQQQAAPAQNTQPTAPASHQDYDVYNMEVPSYGAPQQQAEQPMLGAGDEEEMFFTSVDTDRQKKPIKRPINPRTTQQQQQQKGFLSKFFNKDMPG
jgi:hypothetical protein